MRRRDLFRSVAAVAVVAVLSPLVKASPDPAFVEVLAITPATGGTIPPGTVVWWGDTLSTIPVGWTRCREFDGHFLRSKA